MASVTPRVRVLPWLPAFLLVASVLSGLFIWALVAFPVLRGSDEALARHGDHYAMLAGHTLGGTLMLFGGALALYVGSTRRWFRLHRYIGATYLLGGGAGAVLALVLALQLPHHNLDISSATGTLAAVWLVVAAMAYRAARNRQFVAHQAWMIRSYVLTWTFVLCRLASRVPAVDGLERQASVAVIWLAWIVPFVACEVILQWSATGPRTRRSEHTGE